MTAAEAWQTCSCGKEFHVRGDLAHIPQLCRACSRDLMADHDLCPEALPIPGGSSSCQLTFHHAGRCEPFAAEAPT